MSVLNSTTKAKGRLGLKVVGAAVKNPGTTRRAAKATAPAAKAGFNLRKGLAKRRAARRVERARETARRVGYAVFVQAPQAAQELGLIERPAPKRTAPRIVVGVLLGASAMYLLEPGTPGKQHREKVASLVA
jgi:hypothetical protein